MANIFRYTIEDCNRIMFILKEYVDKQLQKLGYSEDKKYFNYYLFLEIFENRTEDTLQELLQILKEYNVGKEGKNEKCTKLTCFYYTYLNRNLKEPGFHKRVVEQSKINKFCEDIFEYLLEYKQLFRLMYNDNYEISLRNRLNRIKDCLFETTIVGFDEVGICKNNIEKLNSFNIFTLSDFMCEFYKIIYNKEKNSFFDNIFRKICNLDILHPIFNRKKSMSGIIELCYPYNILYRVYAEDYHKVIYIYSKIKEQGKLNSFKFTMEDKMQEILSPRQYKVMIHREKEHLTLSSIGALYGLSGETIRKIYSAAIFRLIWGKNRNKVFTDFINQYLGEVIIHEYHQRFTGL